MATFIAVIAFAVFGFQMLAGRINQRQMLSLVGGCFMIFGAAAITSGISGSPAEIEAPATNDSFATIALKPAAPTGFDPYGGQRDHCEINNAKPNRSRTGALGFFGQRRILVVSGKAASEYPMDESGRSAIRTIDVRSRL